MRRIGSAHEVTAEYGYLPFGRRQLSPRMSKLSTCRIEPAAPMITLGSPAFMLDSMNDLSVPRNFGFSPSNQILLFPHGHSLSTTISSAWIRISVGICGALGACFTRVFASLR